MALDIWFKEDIENAVKAANEATSSTLAMFEQMTDNHELLSAYQQGYRLALVTVATTFGIDLENGELGKALVVSGKGRTLLPNTPTVDYGMDEES